MNETELEEMIVRLTADSSQYIQGMQQAQQSTEETARHILEFTNRIEGYVSAAAGSLAAFGVGMTFRGMFDSFAEAEGISIRLNAAIQTSGQNAEATRARFDALAEEIQRVTVVGDDTALSMLQQATSMGLNADQAERATRNAIALAAATGQSAEAVIRQTSMLEKGHVGRLAMSLGLKGMEEGADQAAAAQQRLNDMWQVATAEAQSAGGSVKQFKEAFGNLVEDLGGVVAAVVTPVIKAATQIVGYLRDAFATVKDVGTEAWETISQKAQDFWAFVKPIFTALWNLAKTVWEGILYVVTSVIDGITAAYNAFVDTVTEAWDTLTGGATISWETIRDVIVEALMMAEFGLRNFGAVAELVWSATLLGFVTMANEIEHFFTVTIPTTLEWFSDEWQNIFTDMWEWTKTVFTNLGNNIVDVFTNIPGLLAGTVSWDEVWKPLTDGFVRQSAELVIPERQMGEWEQQLRNTVDAQTTALGESYDAFRAQRMAAVGASPEVLAQAARGGARIGDAMAKESKAHGSDKMEAALWDSAEAATHLAEYLDRVFGGNEQARAVTAAAAGPAAVASQAAAVATTVAAAATPAASGWGPDTGEWNIGSRREPVDAASTDDDDENSEYDVLVQIRDIMVRAMTLPVESLTAMTVRRA